MQNAGTSRLAQELLSSKEGLCSTDIHIVLSLHVLFQMAQYVNIQNPVLNIFQHATSKYSYCRWCQECRSWFWHWITATRSIYYCSTACLSTAPETCSHCVTDRSNICGMWSVTTRCVHLETDWLLQDAFHKRAAKNAECCDIALRRIKTLDGTFVKVTTVFCTVCNSYRDWKALFYLK